MLPHRPSRLSHCTWHVERESGRDFFMSQPTMPAHVMAALRAGVDEVRRAAKVGPPPVPSHILHIVLGCRSRSRSNGAVRSPGSPPPLLSSTAGRAGVDCAGVVPWFSRARASWEAARSAVLPTAKRRENVAKWVDDGERSRCGQCRREFWLLRRRHHCRSCGEIFCNECSSTTASVEQSGRPERLCDACCGVHLYQGAGTCTPRLVGAGSDGHGCR